MKQEIVETKSTFTSRPQPRLSQNLRKKMKPNGGKIVWAIDPNERESKPLKKIEDILRLWNPNPQKIYPVSILSPLDMGWPMEITRKLRKELLSRAQEKSGRLLESSSLSRSFAEILISPQLSLLAAVEKLLQFAKRQKAEMVALFSRESTEGRITGLGSFAELTVASSKIPVMVIGERTQVPKQISKFLFPTDFSPARKKAFASTLDWARRYNAEIILYHHMGTALTPVTMIGFDLPMDEIFMKAAWEAEQDRVKQKADQWIAEARKKGVSCRLIKEISPTSWSSRALEISKDQNADFVIVSVRRGVWGQAFFGGKIRKLFSQATCPLIVIHTS
jgi:nucleotide-binding universal stress UspA family protein